MRSVCQQITEVLFAKKILLRGNSRALLCFHYKNKETADCENCFMNEMNMTFLYDVNEAKED